jgi:protein TonB
MLAYAASRPRIAQRRASPNAMLVVIGAHVALVAAVMSARMDLPPRFHPEQTIVDFLPLPTDPPQQDQRQTHPARQQQTVRDRTVDHPDPRVGADLGSHELDTTGEDLGTKLPPIDFRPDPKPPVRLDPVRSDAQLLTPASDLKPPYPASKLLNEEEAVLRLRLTIDDHGRVIAVDPVGRTDPVFLAAARRHLIAHWRYKPAMSDGQAVSSSAVITLHFELNG